MGMVCVGPDGPSPALPETRLVDINLRLFDPADGRAAAFLRWAIPPDEKITYFEIYQSQIADTLGPVVIEIRDPKCDSALVRLPVLTRTHTLYYGVRAVWQEETGQKLFGKSIPVDSLTINPSLEILSPSSLSYHADRLLEMEVRTASDDGVVLRQSLFEKTADGWNRMLDTCLPMTACGATIFGNSVQKDAVILQSVPAGDTLEALLCVHGNESFEDAGTGRKQSIECTRFFRINP